MLWKLGSVFLVFFVGLRGRDVSGVATRRRAPVLRERSVNGGGGRGRKVNETLGLALSERTKMRAAYCEPDACPKWLKDGDHYRVPYVFSGGSYTPQQLAAFKWVVEFFARFTNVRFEERGAEETGQYVSFLDDRVNCFVRHEDWPFEDVQTFLTGRCMTTGTISRILMQLAGFYYEHTRPDRDNYVTVQNIRDPTIEGEKLKSVAFSTPYDYASILQLPASSWYTSPSGFVSFVAKNSTFQPVLEADKMALSRCDIAALAKKFKGPVEAPTCVPHELPAVCAPVADCKDNEDACRDQCRMKCQHNLAPASEKPACRLLSVEEIVFPESKSVLPESEGSAVADTDKTAPAWSAGRAAHLSAAVLLGGAVGLAFPLFVH